LGSTLNRQWQPCCSNYVSPLSFFWLPISNRQQSSRQQSGPTILWPPGTGHTLPACEVGGPLCDEAPTSKQRHQSRQTRAIRHPWLCRLAPSMILYCHGLWGPSQCVNLCPVATAAHCHRRVLQAREQGHPNIGGLAVSLWNADCRSWLNASNISEPSNPEPPYGS